MRVSAIRAVGSLKDPQAAEPLLQRGDELYTVYRARRARRLSRPAETNEILEIAAALGRVLAATNDGKAIVLAASSWAAVRRRSTVAFARIAPATYVEGTTNENPDLAACALDVRYGGSADWPRGGRTCHRIQMR